MDADFLIIGAGIAGASAGYELAQHGRVTVLERESAPGYHSTGRSAALYTENYGNAVIRALTVASRPLFESPPEGFGDSPLLAPRGTLMLARADQGTVFAEALETAKRFSESTTEICIDEAVALCPVVNPDYAAQAMYEPEARDMDVNAIHQGYIRGLRRREGRIVTTAEVHGLERQNGGWTVSTAEGDYRAPIVVNAAGAWADAVAELAGVRPIGLVPKRRTAVTFDPPEGVSVETWPAVSDVGETWYYKPEAGRILASPADETPVPPQDIQPEELDIAYCIDRIERATTLSVKRITHSWAGLRSFVADKTPVVGMDAEAPGFFWLAGQGGYGIMTSPALARVAAAMLTDDSLPEDVRDRGVSAEALSPARLH